MKRAIVLGCFILMCVINLHAQMTKEGLQQMYISYLMEQGYQASVDSDGDIKFKAEGRTFFIIVYDDDLQFFSVLFPNFWEIESLAEKEKVFEVANYLNRSIKVVKTYINPREDNVSIGVEIFLNKPEDFKVNFNRIVDLLMSTVREFRDRMSE